MIRDSILLIAAVLAIAIPVQARSDLSQKQARDLIRTIAGWSLSRASVRVRSVRSATADSAEATAELQLVFRLALVDGHWQLAEIRTGQDRWERLEVIARAANVQLPSARCDETTPFIPGGSASELTNRRARCLVAKLFGVELPSDAVRVRDISLFGLSLGSESVALVETLVQADFRFVREGRWRVVEFKSGSRDWVNVSGMAAAMDQIKRSAATDDLSTLARALDDFRRERGYFVISDKGSVLIDHLSPRYLNRVILLDPWQRPYHYDGQPDRYSLRSLGPDGKLNTPDDIVVSGH